MSSGLGMAVRPIRHYADFKGRSTRTELLAFYALTLAVTVGGGYLATMFESGFDDHKEWIGRAAAEALLFCPTVALFVRRLHDQGGSAWWLALAAPALASNAWQFYAAGFSLDPIAELEHPIPGIVIAVGAPHLLAFMVLLLWKDEESTNRYGPNPRYDEPAEPVPAIETAGT